MQHPVAKTLLNENFITSANQYTVLMNILKSTKRSLSDECSRSKECPCEDKIKINKEKERKVRPRKCPVKCGRWEPACDIYMQEDQPYKPPKFQRFRHECCPPPHIPCTQPCDPCPGEEDHSKDSWRIDKPLKSEKSKKGKKSK